MDTNLLAVKEWICQNLGINVHDHQVSNLSARIQQLMSDAKITYAVDFMRRLQAGEPMLVNGVIKAITVQESYFFRDQSLFIFLKETIFPALIKAHRDADDLSLTIWSAGCASGEEIYSLAILLYELIPDLKNWRIYLLGSDIQVLAVSAAQAACYSQAGLRATDEPERSRYFDKVNNYFYLKAFIKNLVKFDYINLAQDQYPPVKFDIVLCRNVFIYFTKDAIEHALVNFKNVLSDNGYLFLGASDFVSYVDHTFKQKIENGVSYYHKALPAMAKIFEEPAAKPLSYIDVQLRKSGLIKQIKASLDSQFYRQTVKEVDCYVDEFGENELLYEYKAHALLELGDMRTAMEYCLKVIHASASAHVYFIKAMIEMDAGELFNAEQSLHMALQLNPRFIEAYYHSGLLFLRFKKIQEGLEQLNKALKLAKEKNLDEKVFMSTGGSMREMISAIECDIQFYQRNHYG